MLCTSRYAAKRLFRMALNACATVDMRLIPRWSRGISGLFPFLRIGWNIDLYHKLGIRFSLKQALYSSCKKTWRAGALRISLATLSMPTAFPSRVVLRVFITSWRVIGQLSMHAAWWMRSVFSSAWTWYSSWWASGVIDAAASYSRSHCADSHDPSQPGLQCKVPRSRVSSFAISQLGHSWHCRPPTEQYTSGTFWSLRTWTDIIQFLPALTGNMCSKFMYAITLLRIILPLSTPQIFIKPVPVGFQYFIQSTSISVVTPAR